MRIPSFAGGTLDVYLSLTTPGVHLDELESLEAWLRDDRDLAGRVRPVRPKLEAGQMGALAEALVVAVGSGGTLSVLAASLRGWLSQPRRSDVRIRVWNENGRVVEIAADRADAEIVLQQALNFTAPEDRHATP